MWYLNIFASFRLSLLVCFIGAFLWAALLSFQTHAQQSASANANSNSSLTALPLTTPLPTPIAPSFIIAEKEKTEQRLDEINRKISEHLLVSQMNADLSELIKDLDRREQETNKLIAAYPSLETLDKSQSYWASLSLSLPSRKNRVQAQATEIPSQLAELKNIQAVWRLTRQSIEDDSGQANKENVSESPPNSSVANVNASNANDKKANLNHNANLNANLGANLNLNSNAVVPDITGAAVNESVGGLPGNLSARVDEILENIKQTQNQVQANRAELIKLQARLAETEKRINETLGKIGAARNALLSNLVVRDSPPIWSGDSFADGFRQDGKKSFAEKWYELRNYFGEHQGLFLLHLLIILTLILAFRWARPKTRGLVAKEPKLKMGLVIFEFPLTSALILGLFFGPFFYLQAPELLGVIVSPLLIVSIFFLFRQLIERPYLPLLTALVALYLINDLRLLAAPIPLLSRLIFLLQMFGAIVFLISLIRSKSLPKENALLDFGYSKAVRKVCILLLIPFLFAFLVNALGYAALAGVVGKTLVSSLTFGLVLYALVQVADSLLIFVFRVPPFSKLRMVKTQRALIQARIFKIAKWLAILIWFIASLGQAYLLTSFFDLLEKVLAFGFEVGAVSISLGSILLFVLIIWCSFLVSRFVRFALAEDVYPRVHLSSGLPYAASTILHYVLLVSGVFLALAAVGIDLTKFTIFLGALGVGVGIGLQNIVENFTSGLILLLERPVKVGDSIQMNQHQGKLEHIGLRASVVKTLDGAEIIVPNGQLITQEVINWTLSDHRRQLEISVGVEYGADPESVIKLLEDVGINHSEADLEIAPRALFLGFGDNALNFELRVWTANQEKLGFIKSDLAIGIYKTLKEAGIEIPFPQRDLHLKSIDGKLLANFNRNQSEKLGDETT